MKKKSLITTILFLLIAVFAFSLAACDKEEKYKKRECPIFLIGIWGILDLYERKD